MKDLIMRVVSKDTAVSLVSAARLSTVAKSSDHYSLPKWWAEESVSAMATQMGNSLFGRLGIACQHLYTRIENRK